MPSRALLPTALALSVLLGCGSAAEERVTFSLDGRSVTTGPIRYCDLAMTSCEQDDTAVAVLAVAAGQPVHIAVPDSVAQAPWQVVFRYRQGGEQIGGRSAVFAPGARSDYTLHVPDSGALEALEVQQYGAPEAGTGEPSFRIRAVWALATPRN